MQRWYCTRKIRLKIDSESGRRLGKTHCRYHGAQYLLGIADNAAENVHNAQHVIVA